MRQLVLAVATIITVATISPAAALTWWAPSRAQALVYWLRVLLELSQVRLLAGFSASHFGGRQLVPTRAG